MPKILGTRILDLPATFVKVIEPTKSYKKSREAA